jgi:hypothetical protein
MTYISPTRVSMYDFLYQDTQPMTSLLADVAQLSLPQTRLALSASLQAIVSALLAYQQRYQGQAVNKKLFHRGAVKELRQHNSMNFATLKATLYYRHDVADAIFGDSARLTKISDFIADQIDAPTSQVQILLSCLCVIALRELAILADYSQLDNDELDKWFALQPQFLSAERFVIADTMTPSEPQSNAKNLSSETDSLVSQPPPFDTYWYELTAFKPETVAPVQDMQQATSHYLKVIGRSPENAQQGRHNDMLVFDSMSAIALPHQRWLLQLAKVSDIYLSRQRLRINSEPPHPPSRPLVSLGLIDGNSDNIPSTASETPIEYDQPVPLWKNPTILIIIVVIGVLGALATFKYQMQKSNGELSATEAVLEQDLEQERKQQDVAIVKVDEDEEKQPSQ